MNKTSLWNHIIGNMKFHLKRHTFLLFPLAIFLFALIITFYTYINKILLFQMSIGECLNIILVAFLGAFTYLYVKYTAELVGSNRGLIGESRKNRRREYLEKKIEEIYVRLYEHLVRAEDKYINGDDKTGQFLSMELGSIFKIDIKNHLYLADEKLREPLRKILESDEKHRVSKNTFDEVKELIQEGLHKYTNELEEITK